jgi:hypothetical protein
MQFCLLVSDLPKGIGNGLDSALAESPEGESKSHL